MRFFVLTLLISFNCYAELNTAQKLVNLFKSKANLVAVKINSQTKDFKIEKIYSANTFELNTMADFKSQTVVLEVWDYKSNTQVLLLSPQGSNEFFEIKDLSYVRSNDRSAGQHILGSLYSEQAGEIEKINLSLLKNTDGLNLSLDSKNASMRLDRLSPVIENQLIENLNTEVTRSAWNGLKIEAAVKINGRVYFKLDSVVRESRLLTHSPDGTLVESTLTSWMDRGLNTNYVENGVILFTENDSKSSNAAYSIEKLSAAEMAKALQFKTFNFKTLLESKVASRTFNPDYYIVSGAGRNLFISEIQLSDVTAESIRSAMYKDVDKKAKVIVKSAVLDSVIEASYDGTMEFSGKGIFLTIYGRDSNDVLKIDMSDRYHPKIVKNDWKVKAVGRSFDANFAAVAESFEKISRKMGAKVLSCKKMIESI